VGEIDIEQDWSCRPTLRLLTLDELLQTSLSMGCLSLPVEDWSIRTLIADRLLSVGLAWSTSSSVSVILSCSDVRRA
jgi:hypothetical protein